MVRKGSDSQCTGTFPEGLKCNKNLQAQFKVYWRYIDCIATQRCSLVTWNSQKLLLIEGTQVLLPSPETRYQARKSTPQLKLLSASTHLHEVHHSYPHQLLQDKQEGKYRHTAPEKTGITPLLQRVDKGVMDRNWTGGIHHISTEMEIGTGWWMNSQSAVD